MSIKKVNVLIMVSFIGGMMNNVQAMQQGLLLSGSFECIGERIKNADPKVLLTRDNAGWVPLHNLFLYVGESTPADEHKNVLTKNQKNELLELYFSSIAI